MSSLMFSVTTSTKTSTAQLSLILISAFVVTVPQAAEYWNWTPKQAEQIGKRMRVDTRAGSRFGFRGLHTERAANYKVRVTWLTPEVIRATARLEQLKLGLSKDETRELVVEADVPAFTVFMVEIDPIGGSGVIPTDWVARLQQKGMPDSQNGAIGVNSPSLREIKGLSGVGARDYGYDRFWVVFPLRNKDGQPLFAESADEAQLIVIIGNMQAKVAWKIPDSIRNRLARKDSDK